MVVSPGLYHQGKSPIHTPQHSSQLNFSRFFVRGAPSPDHPASLPLAATSLAASVSRRCSLPLHRGTLGRTSIVAIAHRHCARCSSLAFVTSTTVATTAFVACESVADALLACELCCSPTSQSLLAGRMRLSDLSPSPIFYSAECVSSDLKSPTVPSRAQR